MICKKFFYEAIMNIFSLALDTLKVSKPWILAALVIYCLAGIIAWSIPEHFDFLEAQFANLMERFADLSAWEFILRIFLHNLVASYLAFCFVVFFGAVPIALAAFNGLLLGWFATWLEQVTWLELAVMLVPHGLFEWPAMFIAFGVGIWRGFGHRLGSVSYGWAERLKRSHCVFLVFVVPLLFVAAIIEGRFHLLELLS